MMKRLIVLSVVMLVVLATAASAALDTAWVVKLMVSDLVNANYGSVNQYGTGTTGQNSQSPGPSVVYMYVAGSEPSYYFRQIRVAEAADVSMVWDLSVAAKSGYTSQQFLLKAWNETASTQDLNQDTAGPDAFTVKLYHGAEVLFEFDPTKNGTSTAPQFTAVYDISPGATLEGAFSLKREPLGGVIPEPGSMLALASGLIGLAGFAVRRRR